MSKEIQEYVQKIKSYLDSKDFPAIFSSLTETEQQVLDALLKANAAISTRGLRDRIILGLAEKKRKELFQAINLEYPDSDIDMISEVQEKNMIEHVKEKKANFKLIKSFISDSYLLKNGQTPFNHTQKMHELELGLKRLLKIKIPSWQNINHALIAMKGLGLIDIRMVEDKRSDTYFIITDKLQKAWKERK